MKKKTMWIIFSIALGIGITLIILTLLLDWSMYTLLGAVLSILLGIVLVILFTRKKEEKEPEEKREIDMSFIVNHVTEEIIKKDINIADMIKRPFEYELVNVGSPEEEVPIAHIWGKLYYENDKVIHVAIDPFDLKKYSVKYDLSEKEKNDMLNKFAPHPEKTETTTESSPLGTTQITRIIKRKKQEPEKIFKKEEEKEEGED